MDKSALIELAGRRWNILDKLRQRRYYMSELKEELGKTLPEISKNLKELEHCGLVQHEQEGKYKYYRTSDLADRILVAVNQATEQKPKEIFEKWKLDELLDMLEDDDLSKELRHSYSEVFQRASKEHPETIARHKKVRKLLEKAAADTTSSKFEQNLMRSLSAVLPHVLAEEEGRSWVRQRLFPTLVKKVRNEKADEETRIRAVAGIGKIALLEPDTKVKRKTRKKLLEVWFSNDTTSNSNVASELTKQLGSLASKDLFEEIKTIAKGSDKNAKPKAETLLNELRGCLLPPNNMNTIEGR